MHTAKTIKLILQKLRKNPNSSQNGFDKNWGQLRIISARTRAR